MYASWKTTVECKIWESEENWMEFFHCGPTSALKLRLAQRCLAKCASAYVLVGISDQDPD